jgi:hypothetical protein
MRIYKIEMLITDDQGRTVPTAHYSEKSSDVRDILSKLFEAKDIQVTRVVASPDFQWQDVEVS